VAFLISRLGNIEQREYGDGDNEQRCIYQVAARTDPFATTKCERDRRIVSEFSVFVEKSLGVKCFRIRIEIWVVKNPPRNVLSEKISDKLAPNTYHELVTIIEPRKWTVSGNPQLLPV
jgi:hypothetical protein